MKLLFTFFSIFLSYLTVYGRPGGSPFCEIPDVLYDRIRNGHGSTVDLVPYDLDVKTQADGTIRIQLTGDNAFGGLLLYVSGANPREHLGRFENVNEQNLRFMEDVCRSQGVLESSPRSTVTHRDSSKKSTQTEFIWRALPGDESKQGPFKVTAIMTYDFNPFIRRIVPVTFQVAGNSSQQSPPSTTVVPAPPQSSSSSVPGTSTPTASPETQRPNPSQQNGSIIPCGVPVSRASDGKSP